MTETGLSPRPLLDPSAPRGGIGVRGFFLSHFLAAVFPATAGIVLYGWHALAVIAGVLFCTALALAIWRQIGVRGRMIHPVHALWFGLLLSLMLSAQLAAEGAEGNPSYWPLIPIAALLLVMTLWLFGGLGGSYTHPVLVSYLVLAACFPTAMVSNRILTRDHLLIGELMHASSGQRPSGSESWISRKHNEKDAELSEPAAGALSRYTSGRERPVRLWLPLSALLRDAMPPLEDFIVAGQPGAIGTSSVVAVIVGGLFLMYRGMIDFRIPLLIILTAYVAMLILPIPTIIAGLPQWHWLAFRQPDIGWSVGITFVNYELMASPLMFTAFFLASAPVVRPTTGRGRAVFAVMLGLAAAAAQLYVSVADGPYLALLIVTLLTPAIDRVFGVRPLF
jgi:electron transport complex protein RnfD